ncbi:MAG: hypothetical protein KDD69_07190 [Bdellovibrionales bacterium]|nr:hypothetical protein [Bdellovibrionales bacterium]
MAENDYTADAAPSVGDRVLIRFNFCDEEGNVVEEQQFMGAIESISDDEVVLTHPKSGKQVTLPPYFGSYTRPERGTYDLPSTGEQMVDPDYITEWTLRASSGQ